ncbi:MAG: bifunctional 3-(3-hydroxy-phenyl)propionate/3-hydroxycinnamic acid hydroxylase [Myxococcota bacterium]
MRQRCDVAIVGYGPTGQMLAILLAQRGWRVTVLERWPNAYPLPRAVHFDHEIGRILQAAGVADELRGLAEPCRDYEWRNAAGETLLRFGPESEISLSGWPEANLIHQPDLEGVLDRRARSFRSVSVRRGFEVFEIKPRGERVRVRARDASGQLCDVDARFAVGCDGANSFVRRALRVPVEDFGFESDWLIVDLVTHRPRAWSPANWQLCDPARPTTVISGGPGRRRFEFMRLPHETIESLSDPSTAWKLLEPWGLGESNASLERHSVYTFRARWAEIWRSGRVLLAGDAAHQLPPFAAQGLGSGLRDAATLAWKLDLVLVGRAPDALLDTYALERLPHVRGLIGLSLALGRLMFLTDPAEAAVRDVELMALARARRHAVPVPPAMGCGTLLEGDPHAGELTVQGRVRVRDGARVRAGLFDDVVGRGWVLFGADCDPVEALEPDARKLFESLGGISAHVGAGAPVEDLDGRYTRLFERTRARVVLQRPDFHVFGCGKDPSEARMLVDALARQLTSPVVPEEAP